jgi:hypothetical protein
VLCYYDIVTFFCASQLPVVDAGQISSTLDFIRLTHHSDVAGAFPDSVSVVRGDWGRTGAAEISTADI